MELHTETIYRLANIEAATLEEQGTGEGTLNLEFAGFGPAWLTYMEPVTLYHKGRLLFHGKITSVRRSNGGGTRSSSATVSNFMWLLDRQTLGQQIAEIEAAAQEGNSGGSGGSSGRLTSRVLNFTAGQIGKSTAGKTGGVTWGSVTGSMSVTSSGWKAGQTLAPATKSKARRSITAATGENADGWMPDVLTVQASPSVAGRTVWAVTDKLITTASALVKMREKAADIQFIIDYAAGTCTAMAIGDMPTQTWDTSARGIIDIGEISPQYEACVTGVAVAWTSDTGSVTVHKFPADLSMSQDGVKVFSLSGAFYVESWDTVAREYYEAANVLQWGGSIVVHQSYVDASPLGGKINLIGPGTHESWQDMEAVVSSCSWDFMARTLTVNLGREFADPEFADAQETEDGGEEEEPLTTDMGNDPGDDPEEDTQEDSEDMSDEVFPDESGQDSDGGSDEASEGSEPPAESEDGTASSSGTASGSGTGSSSGGTASGSNGGSQGGSGHPGGTDPDFGSESGSGSDEGTASGSGTGSGGGSSPEGSTPGGTGSGGGSSPEGSTPGGTGSGGGSSPEGSTPGGTGSGSNPEGSTPGGTGTSGTPCDCAEKWAALEEWKKSIEDRLKALEDANGSAECACVAQVQAAIDAALANAPASVGGSASSEVQGNANGTLTVTTSWKY